MTRETDTDERLDLAAGVWGVHKGHQILIVQVLTIPYVVFPGTFRG
jgi:hypothetical protein